MKQASKSIPVKQIAKHSGNVGKVAQKTTKSVSGQTLKQAKKDLNRLLKWLEKLSRKIPRMFL